MCVCYNNLFMHLGTAQTIDMAPQSGDTSYVYNNVIADPNPSYLLNCAPSFPPGGTCALYNNTVECGADPTPNGNCGSGAGITGWTVENNHFVVNNYSDASDCPSNFNSGGGFVSPTCVTNVFQAISTANAQGYNVAQTYPFSPISPSNATAKAGTNLSGLCSALPALCTDTTAGVGYDSVNHKVIVYNRIANSRPASGPWDAGAYAISNLAPSNPVVSQINLSSVTIAFGAVGASNYKVDGSTASDFSGVLFSATGISSPLSSQGLAPNTTYYLRVGALWGPTTFYANANPASVITMAASPGPLSLTGIGLNQFTVNWQTNGNPTNTTYQVAVSTDINFGVFTSSLAVVSPPAPSNFTFTSLLAGTTYYARVGASNFAGAPSGYAFGAAITVGGVLTVSANRLTQTWYNNASALFYAQGASIYHYTITPNASDAAGVSDPTFNGSALTAALSPNANYFHVLGRNATDTATIGTANYGPIYIDIGTPLVASIGAQISATNTTPIMNGGSTSSPTPRFLWSTPASLSPIAGYSLSISTNPAAIPGPAITTVATFQDQPLNVSGLYYIKVSALNMAGTLGPPAGMSLSYASLPMANQITLKNNYFNPIQGGCMSLQVANSTAGHVKIELYSLLGRKISTLIDSDLSAGTFNYPWCGRNSSNELVATGIYLLHIETPTEKKNLKVAVVK